jgi:hypothetical protein
MVPPVGHQQGDRCVLWAINKLEDKTPAISGLTPIGTATGGTGAAGVDVGQQRITVWEFDEGAALVNVPITITGALNSLGGGYSVRPAAGEVFKPSTVLFAWDTASGTSFAAVMASNQGFQLNDWAIQIATLTHGAPGLPGRSFTIPGVTLTGAGGVPLNSVGQNSTGNHQYTYTDRGQVTAGAQSAAATAGGTTTQATTGGAAHVRLSVWKTAAVGTAAETDDAQPVGRRKTRAALTASETDSAQPVGRRKVKVVTGTGEVDTALAVARRKARALGTAVETSVAQAVGRWKTYLLGPAFESDTALPVGRTKRRPLGIAGEVDEAMPVTGGTTEPTGPTLDLRLTASIEPDRYAHEVEPDRYSGRIEP